MRIYQTAEYRVRPEGIESVLKAISEFVEYVTENEPGTVMYTAWQQEDDPTKFVHLFEFADEDAQSVHGESTAVRAFEGVYKPFLADGPVRFTNYVQVAAKKR